MKIEIVEKVPVHMRTKICDLNKNDWVELLNEFSHSYGYEVEFDQLAIVCEDFECLECTMNFGYFCGIKGIEFDEIEKFTVFREVNKNLLMLL